MKNKEFVVLGLGLFGQSVAEELFKSGAEVLAVDINADRVDEIQNRVTHAVQADASDPDVLEELGVQNFDTAIVTIGTDLKASSVITMLLRDLGVPTIVAKAQDEMHGRMLQKLGADRIIYAERDMGRRVAHSLISGNILDYIVVSDDFALVEIEPLPMWLNRSLGELNLRKKPGVNVIAILTDDVVRVTLDADTVIRSGDRLLVIGEQSVVSRL